MMGVLYLAIAAALAAAGARRPDDHDLATTIRAALWVAWAHLLAAPSAQLALLHALVFAAAALISAPWPDRRAWPAVLGAGALGLALQRIGTGVAPHAGAMALALGAAGSGGWLQRAMREGRALAGRLVLHWISFAGTIAYLVPRSLQSAGMAAPSLVMRLAAVTVLLPALALAIAGTRAMARAGGTPEPLDAPPRLAQDGVFARVRNPIQLAEIGLVVAAALWWPHPATAAWALAFSALLVGPVRWYEERRLGARFGLAYARYRRRTPAYWPRARA